MRYSINSRDGKHMKGYGFSSFVKNTGKSISSNYSQRIGVKSC